jgi:hypothetical protein
VKRSPREGRWADLASARARFILEAAFVLLVALGAALMELRPLAIVVLTACALVLVALIERAGSRKTGRAPSEEAGEELPLAEEEPEPETATEPGVGDAEREEKPGAATVSQPSEEAPGPVVTKRPLDLPGLEQTPVSIPVPRPRRALARAARRVVQPPAPPPTPPPAPPAREWNLWDLERRAREQAGNAPRDEEWSALFTHLRVFANADGVLPKEFDKLVRESFGELIEAA